MFCVALVRSHGAGAATYKAGPADYAMIVKSLKAGDTLRLSAGEYRQGLALHLLTGTPEKPITIEGDGEVVFRAREGHNTVSIVDSSYLIVRNLDLEGDNLPVDAVKAEGHSHSVHHITLENLIIAGHGNNQQTVGISTKCPAWDWIIRGNTIIRAGTGLYLGNSDGTAPFFNGIIERNLIVDTRGYNLQIKHQVSRPRLDQEPAQPAITIIRDNIFVKAHTESSPDGFRPNVLVGHFPLHGAGSTDQYAVYGNFFYENPNEALFQGEGNVSLYSNVFVNTQGDAVHIQPHNDVPRRVWVAYNTVVARDAGIILRNAEDQQRFPQLVDRNVVFAGEPIMAAEQAANFTAAFAEAPNYLRRPFAPLGRLDVFPRASLPPPPATPGREAAAFTSSLPDATMDFDGRRRNPATWGAYGSDTTSPAWLPRLSLKPTRRSP